ncbi:MAG: DUF4349 domain-containing protein [Ilumatobacter sp.]|uniref:DUF4349 domain-containing protein n=1 Tax=Ilumatobacter sp. TaxID=1967498 RepID=UPI00262F7101|nr:DUF4349 domain-containing protein [Ilumatobacter sp.]MDJ0769745.1 DUF4349 domain-containing protein [Ilumatobacter sp.]
MGRNTAAPIRRRRTIGAVIVSGTLVLAACGGDDDDGGDDATADEEAGVDAAVDDAAADDAAADTGDDFVATREAPEQDGGFDIGVIGRDVIIEMGVVVSSDNVQRTVASIMATASSLGGGVASSNVDYGAADDNGDDFAVLTVKVPPGAVDRFLSGLDDTGTVQSINQSARDVTEQLIDLDVRISNARQSVENVRGFMEQATDLNDLVSLESELTRRQTELEQLEAQQRNLSDRVALSTITIEVVPTAAVPEPVPETDEGIGDAFATGWNAFVAVFFALGFVLAVLAPFLGVAVVIGAIALLITRTERRRRAERALPSPTAALRSTPPAEHATEPPGDPDEPISEPEPVSANQQD